MQEQTILKHPKVLFDTISSFISSDLTTVLAQSKVDSNVNANFLVNKVNDLRANISPSSENLSLNQRPSSTWSFFP